MKKLLISLFLISGLFIGGKGVIVNAEEPSDVVEETSIEEISNSVEESDISSNVLSEIISNEESKNIIEDKLNEWFSPAVVANIMSWLAYIATIIGLVNNLKKAKKDNNLTLGIVKEQVCGELEKVVNKEVTEKVASYFDAADKLQKEIKDVLEIFAKIMALSQENTPESRIAILELIQRLGSNTSEMIENIKSTIDNQVKEEETKKIENNKELDKIIDDGTNI